jgi:hypothetical protein
MLQQRHAWKLHVFAHSPMSFLEHSKAKLAAPRERDQLGPMDQPRMPRHIWKQWLLVAALLVAGLLVYSGWTGG